VLDKNTFLTEYIHGDKIADLAHISINSPEMCRGIDELGMYNQIVFCKTDFIKDLFMYLNRHDNDGLKIILITHNSDFEIDERLWELRPRCIKYWFAENANINKNSLTVLPLGLERPGGGGYSSDHNVIANLIDSDIDKDFLCFMCHNENNNKEERGRANEILKDRPWLEYRKHGLSFNDYCANVARSKFVVCPPGNGLDCHRVWEALYLGAIPILKHSAWAEYWNDLPVLIVNDWHEVTEDNLINTYNKYELIDWCSDKLKMSYWKGLLNVR